MGKRNNKTKNKSQRTAIVTMKALEEISDDDDNGELPPESEWDAQAKALKAAIETGQFDQALQNTATEGEEFEEVVLESSDDENMAEEVDGQAVAVEEQGESDSSQNDDQDDDEEPDESQEDDNSADAAEDDDDNQKPKAEVSNNNNNNNNSNNNTENESDDDDEETDPVQTTRAKALRVVTDTLMAEKKTWPWAERFSVVTGELPFDQVDIHDDLKREVVFYKAALEGVVQAKKLCKEANVLFKRPDDFFAEMVKTDDHMAKIKDRLIFETKKMEAVAQRKANKEIKLRAKESRSNKVAEKAKRKKEHFQAVEEWAKSAAANRGNRLEDFDDVEARFRKRQRADQKYGFGGKRGRFKQNDRKSLNDMSDYNPRGNFPGGMKKTKNGSGANRKGKRARDAQRRR